MSLLAVLSTLPITTQAFEWWNPFKAPEGVSLEIDAPYIDMHSGPGRGYPVFHVLERGDVLRITKRFTDWYQVRTEKGREGWVKREALDGSLFNDGTVADFSRPKRGDYEGRRLEFGFSGGSFSGSASASTYLGYHLTNNISAELHYTQAFGDFSNTKLYRAAITHQPWPAWRISPFFNLGSGIMQTSPNSSLVLTEDREDSVLTVGGGLFVYASRNFLLRLEFDNHTVLTSREQNDEVDEWKAGFSVFF